MDQYSVLGSITLLPPLSGWGWSGDPWALAAAVTLPLDDDLIGVVGEAVEGALGQDGIIEEGDPLVDYAVGCDDGGRAAVALDDDLIEVAGLLGIEAAQAEVIELCRALHNSIHVEYLFMWSRMRDGA